MPHDAKGRIISVGDVVLVPFRVKAIHSTEDFCNCDLETIATMPPEHRFHTSLSAINTQMTIRAKDTDPEGATFFIVHQGSGGVVLRGVAPKDDPAPQKSIETPLQRRGARDFS